MCLILRVCSRICCVFCLWPLFVNHPYSLLSSRLTGNANTSVWDNAARQLDFFPLFFRNFIVPVFHQPCKSVFLTYFLKNKSTTFCCHHASFRNRTASNWCCCWSSDSFIRAREQRATLTAFLNERDAFAWLPTASAKLELCCGLFAMGQWHPRPCRPSCQLEASDSPPYSNVVFHGLFARQICEVLSFGRLISVVWPDNLLKLWAFTVICRCVTPLT